MSVEAVGIQTIVALHRTGLVRLLLVLHTALAIDTASYAAVTGASSGAQSPLGIGTIAATSKHDTRGTIPIVLGALILIALAAPRPV